jgi:polyphenol oxidase
MLPYEVFRHPLKNGDFVTFGQRPEIQLKKVFQKHTNIVLDSYKSSGEMIADGLISKEDTNLCIVTADCIPLFIQGEQGVSMLHAGWRGLENNILQNKLLESIKPNFAFIGPSITAKNYEVTAEFLSYFPHSNSILKENNKYFFDLRIECINQLRNNFAGIVIEKTDVCTFDSPNLHSFRENQTKSRNWNVYIPH